MCANAARYHGIWYNLKYFRTVHFALFISPRTQATTFNIYK